MSGVGGPTEALERPHYVIDVGAIRVAVDNEKDAAVARWLAQELAALRGRPKS